MSYDYYFNQLADSRVKDWLFMADPFPSSIIIILYLLFVTKLGPLFMENRKPFKLTNIIRCYNIFQIVCCGLLFYGVGSCGWFSGELSFGCEPVDYSDKPNSVCLARYVWWTYCLKIVELIETVFFVLRKKYNQVSNLHLYHHTSTLAVCWTGTKYVAGGMSTFPIMINCVVHFIMYGYYFLSTLGPEWQSKLSIIKNKITLIQMIQFTIVLAHSSQILLQDCNFPTIAAVMFIPNVVLVYYMFYNFYTQAYTKENKLK